MTHRLCLRDLVWLQAKLKVLGLHTKCLFAEDLIDTWTHTHRVSGCPVVAGSRGLEEIVTFPIERCNEWLVLLEFVQ